ncbi:hypothetical protein D3C81_1472850 [compost metagenome]
MIGDRGISGVIRVSCRQDDAIRLPLAQIKRLHILGQRLNFLSYGNCSRLGVLRSVGIGIDCHNCRCPFRLRSYNPVVH